MHRFVEICLFKVDFSNGYFWFKVRLLLKVWGCLENNHWFLFVCCRWLCYLRIFKMIVRRLFWGICDIFGIFWWFSVWLLRVILFVHLTWLSLYDMFLEFSLTFLIWFQVRTHYTILSCWCINWTSLLNDWTFMARALFVGAFGK